MTQVSRPVLVFDGDCGFCPGWVARFKRWERGDQVDLMPLQHENASAITGRNREQLGRAMCLALPDGRRFDGADAARELMSFVRGGWLGRAALALPGSMPVARRVYAWVAGRRHQLGCSGEHCSVTVADRGPPG